MFQVIYSLLIQPLEILLKELLTGAYGLTGSYGLSILLMSVGVNILIAPFYALADGWQKEEQALLKRMQKKRDDIRAVFKGDERYFYMKTLHRQSGYSPFMALRSSFGLLIQIPFFIAAYRFLSEFGPLRGESFLVLRDLASPDALAGVINIMPFVMTALNLASAYVFAGEQSRRGRYQLYGMALLFLVLLYNSPSGLLLYWSCNNLISLIKNLMGKSSFFSGMKSIPPGAGRLYRRLRLPAPLLVLTGLYILGSLGLYYLLKNSLSILLVKVAYFPMFYLALLSTLSFVSRFRKEFYHHLILLGIFALWGLAFIHMVTGPFDRDLKELMMTLILIAFGGMAMRLLASFNRLLERRNALPADAAKRGMTLSLLILIFLAGVLVPTGLVASSPGEMGLSSGLLLRIFTWALFSLALVPLFLLSIAPGDLKKSFIFILFSLTIISLVNFLFFPGDYGVISESLQFEFGKAMDAKTDILSNLAVCGAVVLLLLALTVKGWMKQFNHFLAVVLAALVVLTGMNLMKISRSEGKELVDAGESRPMTERIIFSKDEPNTVILFMDRALAGAVPVALESCPELRRLYDGFSWYPDTLSFGVNTITTLPAMLGGYEYDPQGMISRPELSLRDKAKEGLMVLPEIFRSMGSFVYVSIPLHKGFGLQPDDLDALQKEDTRYEDLKSLYARRWLTEQGIPADFGQFLKRDKSLFMFSLFRMAPKYFRNDLYDDGFWHSMNRKDPRFEKFNNLHNAISFLEEWAVLDSLPRLSGVKDRGPTFSIIGNKASHEVLGVDSRYRPTAARIDYPQQDLERYGNMASAAHIYTNVAVLRKITAWLEWMKSEGVYDNTQIIIVADHGRAGEDVYDPFFKDAEGDGEKPEYVGFHPLLMFKPFDAEGELEISDRTMTNADVPSLVLEAFGGAVNPFTGKVLDRKAKEAPLLIGDGPNLIYKHSRSAYRYEKQYFVEGSMLNPENWSAAE